jgi:hypothetical protein
MEDDFWGSPRSGGHRKPDADPSIRGGLRALVRVPTGVPAWLWYIALGMGAVASVVALGGLGAALLGLVW